MPQRRERPLKASREDRFRSLYESHVERVAGYVARRAAPDEVQDVVSETFLAAWRRFDELPREPVPWLFVTARKLIANRHRATKRRGALHDKLAGSVWVPPPQDEPTDVDARLLAAIRALPEAEREAFMLVAWDELDIASAARTCGCSTATFRMRLHRARRRLQRSVLSQHPFRAMTDITAWEESR